MKNIKERFMNSYFMVNKMYLIFIFIFLAMEDLTLGFYYFLFGAIIYTLNTLNSKVPVNILDEFEESTFVYKTTDDRELKLDLWLPNNGKEKHPLVFFCHGGGWISGFRNQPNNVSWCKFFAANDIAAVSIDYRYGFKNTMEDILMDYSDALSFVKKHSQEFSIDDENIVLMGLSAGAHLSMLYGSYNSYKENKDYMKGIKSIVSYYCPSDLSDILIDDNKSLFARFALKTTIDNEDEEIERIHGKEEILKFYSPITWVNKNMPPVLLLHCKKDNTVPYISSVKMSQALEKYQVDYQFLTHSQADHSLTLV